MKRHILILTAVLFAICVQVHADETESYFDDETRWTELRLDTTKYGSWFTETYVDGVLTWVPNYEKTEFYVQVDTVDTGSRLRRFGYVWQHVEGQPDSVRFAMEEQFQDNVCTGFASLAKGSETGEIRVLGTITTYQFGWREGVDLYSGSLEDAGFAMSGYEYSLGRVGTVNEGCFGTDKVLQYIDADTLSIYYCRKQYRKDYVGAKLIRGIGVNKWKSRYCIVGPSYPANTTPWMSDPYMSILVHFERGGEVLYDLWPTPEGGLASHVQGVKAGSSRDNRAVYDLQGRKVEGKPSRGIYVIGGKVMVK